MHGNIASPFLRMAENKENRVLNADETQDTHKMIGAT
jgi:hypothetical protein